MAERFALPRTITGSTWGNVWGTLWEKPPRGVVADDEGTIAPKWTNREAVAVIAELRSAATRAGKPFALWYQFAAVAYGWDPASPNLDNSSAQADRVYAPDASVMLMLTFQGMSIDLDESTDAAKDPALHLDSSKFDDPVFQAEVKQALESDGATIEFKVPLPACKDPKTGKPIGKPTRNPRTGKWECQPVLIDDPATVVIGSLSRLLIPLAALWLLWEYERKQPRRDRRRKR